MTEPNPKAASRSTEPKKEPHVYELIEKHEGASFLHTVKAVVAKSGHPDRNKVDCDEPMLKRLQYLANAAVASRDPRCGQVYSRLKALIARVEKA